jgi:DNA-binding LacI/PurR family transcriptional regulator
MRAITNALVDRIATEASVNKATVAKYLAGMYVRPGGQQRIEAALRKLRMRDLIRPQQKQQQKTTRAA